MEENLKLGIYPDQFPIYKKSYKKLGGTLMYLAHSWPDLAYALSVVNQIIYSPNEKHMNVVTHILCYLKSSMGKAIMLKKKKNNLDFKGYTNTDWAGSIKKWTAYNKIFHFCR
jgi:uncharacterized membrane protein